MTRPPASDRLVLAVVLPTFALGIPLDALWAGWVNQLVVDIWVWGVLVWVATRSSPAHRFDLAVCVVLATLGELFLMEVWGLYEYRLGNLPLFIPPGHALAFTTAHRLSRRCARWFPWVVVALFAPYVLWAGWVGFDTQALVWFTVFVAYVWWGHDPRMYGVAFLFALVVETWGTGLGGWRYYTVEPWFGLTTTNPPVCIGAIYSTLEVLVRATSGGLLRWFPGNRLNLRGSRRLA